MAKDCKARYFWLGCAVGVAAAVIFAPASAAHAFAYLRQKTNEGADLANETIDDVRDVLNRFTEQAIKNPAGRMILRAAADAGKRLENNGRSHELIAKQVHMPPVLVA